VGEEMEVHALKQRYGTESFLVARPAGSSKIVARAALHATYEALLRGTGCRDVPDDSSRAWFLDVGTDDDELLALASSLGCGVSVLDSEVKDVKAVDMTRCMNEEPNRPFVVFEVNTGSVTNPDTLANMTSMRLESNDASVQAHQKSLIGLAKPTMLNKHLRKASEKSTERKENEEKHETTEAATQKPAPEVRVAEPVPLDKTVMLDTIFLRPDTNASNSGEVTGPAGQKFLVNKVNILKVTKHSESDATLKALQGARRLLGSGRVQCLVTEMNFDMNHTDAFLKYVVDLEHMGFQFAHLGSLDYSELEITNEGQYEVFSTNSKQLNELYDTYKRIRSFDERSGFRVYSGSLSLDRKGHYFDYTDLIFACRDGFPKEVSVLPQGKIRFRNGVWWLEKDG
jgi:hypothetical protein